MWNIGNAVARHFVGLWELLRVWDCMLELLLELLLTVARHFVGDWELLRVWDYMLELLLELLLTVTVARRFLGLLLRGTSWGTGSCFGDEKGSCDGPENDFDDCAENDFDEGPEVDNQLRRVSIREGIINGL